MDTPSLLGRHHKLEKLTSFFLETRSTKTKYIPTSAAGTHQAYTAMSTGYDRSKATLTHRKAAAEPTASIATTAALAQPEEQEKTQAQAQAQVHQSFLSKWLNFNSWEPIVAPLLFTALGLYVRLYLIDKSKKVVWDEAHFGKFGSYYIKHEFYHDVHPPLGKMLIALSEYIAGFDGNFEFKSGTAYPEDCDVKTIRVFNALFSAAVVPVTYYIVKWLNFSRSIIYLLTLMVTLETSYITLGKFILLDSILLFFTATTFLTLVKVHSLRIAKKEFTWEWYTWLVLSGISVGCVCSVKWVGLFVTIVVGLYTVQDLLEKLFDDNDHDFKWWSTYAKHWSIRILTLIVIPFIIYLICFKIHFALLYKSGTGDASTSSLFQVNLENHKIHSSPRDILYGSEVTIRSHGISPNLLHSHVQVYPEGSNQQQITGYSYSDGNNNWIFKYSRESGIKLPENDTTPVLDGDILRLVHKSTLVNLHSHDLPGHVTKKYNEVSGYGNEKIGDSKDDWKIEIVQQLPSDNKSYPLENNTLIHPLSTSFRLQHVDLGCYLSMTGASYPAWGFKQSEVICKPSWSKLDKSTWWNIEHHVNPILPIDSTYIPPKSNFWSDFVSINFAMAASNNALVPDADKFDSLASKWWQWPSLYVGLRMCGWGTRDQRYFLIGGVFNTLISTLSVFAFIIVMIVYILKYQRQTLDWKINDLYDFLLKGAYPFIAWLTHYLPFVLMGRVTYVHHYVPALFFAILVFGYVLELGLARIQGRFVKAVLLVILYAATVYSWWYFRAFSDGMNGDYKNFEHLNVLKSWTVI
jgi:dolichyl-phosphate-mannose-protein mannosyltransferase